MNQHWRVRYNCPDDITRSQIFTGSGLLDVIQQALTIIALDDIIKIELEN